MDMQIPENQSDRPHSSLMQWLRIWAKAFILPAESNFRLIASDARLSGGRALVWLILITIFGFEFPVIYLLSRGELSGPDRIEVMVPFLIIPILILLMIFVVGSAGMIHILGRRFKGAGTFGDFLGVLSTLLMPYVILIILGILFQVSKFALLPLGAYFLVQFVVATKAVYQINWGQAVASVLAVGLLLDAIVLIFIAWQS